MRTSVTCLIVAVALALAAGCGSDDSDSSTDERTEPAGFGQLEAHIYTGNSRVVSSSIKVDAGSEESDMEAIFSCADEDCSEMFMRTTFTEGLLARTFRLDVDGEQLTFTGTTREDCVAPSVGASTQELSVDAEVGEGGTVEGTLDYEAAGCGEPVKSSLAFELEPVADGELPYLEGKPAAATKEAVTELDRSARGLYDNYVECAEQVYSKEADEADAGGTCLSKHLTAYAEGLEEFAEEVPALAKPARGHCADALEGVGQLDTLVAAAKAAATAFEKGRGAGSYVAANKLLTPVVTESQEVRPRLVNVAKLCIAPDDLDGLGAKDDGRLSFDIGRDVPPRSEEEDITTERADVQTTDPVDGEASETLAAVLANAASAAYGGAAEYAKAHDNRFARSPAERRQMLAAITTETTRSRRQYARLGVTVKPPVVVAGREQLSACGTSGDGMIELRVFSGADGRDIHVAAATDDFVHVIDYDPAKSGELEERGPIDCTKG